MQAACLTFLAPTSPTGHTSHPTAGEQLSICHCSLLCFCFAAESNHPPKDPLLSPLWDFLTVL